MSKLKVRQDGRGLRCHRLTKAHREVLQFHNLLRIRMQFSRQFRHAGPGAELAAINAIRRAL